MKFKFVDWYSWCVTVLVLSCFLLICSGLIYGLSWLLSSFTLCGDFFFFDILGFYLCLLSLLILLSFVFIVNELNGRTIFMLFVSVLSSILCYISCNVLLFWLLYELSILSLLYLLISDSPYSERYSAFWYLVGYIILTSLPMLLCMFYLVLETDSLNMVYWNVLFDHSSECYAVVLILGVMFITKVPVPPFHVWLPIVHAEASSAVSVCLSGYIMKLGLLGVCRFCYFILPDYLFNYVYVGFVFCLSISFFFSACRELDGKRWLAFLSLSHIIIVVVCLYCCDFSGASLGFIYSLGHGLSAGLVFIFLWWVYELSGSRNWCVVKNVLGGSLLFRFLVVASLFTVGSLPPVVQFFCELMILSNMSVVSLFLSLILCVYLFLSSLVPFFLLGGLLSRHFSVSQGGDYYFGFMTLIIFMIIWSFVVFFI